MLSINLNYMRSKTHLLKQSWSIIILCYNEKGSIAKVIREANLFLKSTASKYELIIIDDGSSDGSVAVIRKSIDKLDCAKLLVNRQNLGIGRSLRKAYDLAKYENICFIPGDGQFNITELYAYPSIPKHNIVSFYRRENLYYTDWRNTLSTINKMINRLLLGINIKDINWVKIYKKSDLKNLKLRLTSSLVESEICAKLLRNGVRVIEVESEYLPRIYGKSKGVSPKIVYQAIRDICALIISVNLSDR